MLVGVEAPKRKQFACRDVVRVVIGDWATGAGRVSALIKAHATLSNVP